MSFHHSPQIVTDGLVLCLDAKDPKSYYGAGTTWYDRSPNNNNSSLTGTVTYESSGAGALNFDPSNAAFSGSFNCNRNYYSLDFWIYPTSLLLYNQLIQFNNGWGAFTIHSISFTSGMFVGTDLPTRITPWRNGVYESNKWQNFTWTFESGLGKIYKNGVLETEKTMAISTGDFSSFSSSTNAQLSLSSKLSAFRVYSNKVLSQKEIFQNYNAQKGRFGL